MSVSSANKDRLFHFWGKDKSEDEQFEIFESIVCNGLLLTVPRENQRDMYWYFGDDNNQWRLKVRQSPRVCFTSEASSGVGDRFGRFGVAIELEAGLRWGIAPVWYIPNRHTEKTQHGRFGEVVSRIAELADDLKEKNKGQDINDRDRKIAALEIVLSYSKGMSSDEDENRSFLIEKEWRLAQGFPYGREHNDLPLRELTDDKKRKFPNGRYFFNGLKGSDSVASNIIEVRVPSPRLQERVVKFVDGHKDLFREGVPVTLWDDSGDGLS